MKDISLVGYSNWKTLGGPIFLYTSPLYFPLTNAQSKIIIEEVEIRLGCSDF